MVKKRSFRILYFVTFSMLFLLSIFMALFIPLKKGNAATPVPDDTQIISLFDFPFVSFLPLITNQNLQNYK